MTPLVVENEPPVTFLRRKMTGGRFSMGVVIRRYTGRKQLASRFNFTYRYIDDVFSITTQSLRITCARCIPLNLRSQTRQRATLLLLTWIYFRIISIERDCQSHSSIYGKRDYFNFHITNFLFVSINIPASLAYGVFISQCKRYDRACPPYKCLILRATRL